MYSGNGRIIPGTLRRLGWLYSVFGKSLCTYKRCSSIEGTIVSKNLIKKLHTLPVLNFNYCLTTEYSETTAHFNGNVDIDNQIYVQYHSLSAQRLSERTVYE
jgi:hypothetical protein